MDPIGAISYAKDSTLAMLLAAQARGLRSPTRAARSAAGATASRTGACAASP